MGIRRKARESALKILYSLEYHPSEDVFEVIGEFWETFPLKSETEKERKKIWSFTKELVVGTCKEMSHIDRLVEKHAKNWTLKRMSRIDRNILRFSVYELLFMKDIPDKVTINEALEIAKQYGTDDSWRFVNGILDVILKSNCVTPSKEVLGKTDD